MSDSTLSAVATAVVRRNTEEVQGKGNFDIFEELFADDFVDHTPQPNATPDKAGVRKLYTYMRAAFPDFHAEIHWQLADADRVTTYKTYYGTHEGALLGVAPTHRSVQFETDPATGLLSMRKQPIFFDTNNVARFNHSLMLEGSLKCWNSRKPEL